MVAGAGGDERPKEKSSSGLDPEAAALPVDTLESKENALAVVVAKAVF